MNDAETLAAIRELAELRRKATPGPWLVGGEAAARDGVWATGAVTSHDEDGASSLVAWCHSDWRDEQDAAFIAAAGSLDFDALLALLDAEAARHREVVAALPTRAFRTEAGDRLLAHNSGRDRATLEWLTNDIRAIEQEEFDKVLAEARRVLQGGAMRVEAYRR